MSDDDQAHIGWINGDAAEVRQCCWSIRFRIQAGVDEEPITGDVNADGFAKAATKD
jgi:hypothetical protein